MAPALSAGQLALARHCLAYNDATDYHLHKLSSIDIQDIVQCSAATLCRLRKSWKKTGDVERLCKAGGRPRKIEDRLEHRKSSLAFKQPAPEKATRHHKGFQYVSRIFLHVRDRWLVLKMLHSKFTYIIEI
jgi:hypothetical protein